MFGYLCVVISINFRYSDFFMFLLFTKTYLHKHTDSKFVSEISALVQILTGKMCMSCREVQYTTCENSLEANFKRNTSWGASRMSLWNQVPSTELKMSRTRIKQNRIACPASFEGPTQGTHVFCPVSCAVYCM